MNDIKVLTIWDRLQVEQTVSDTKAQKKPVNKTNGLNLKIVLRIGNILGILFWLYALTQVIFFDVDAFLKTILPKFVDPLVDYKFFIFLLTVAIISIFVKKYYLLYLYIVFYPLIVIFWEFPRLIYQFKSWILFLSVLDIIGSFFHKLKYNIVMTTITLFGFLLVLVFNSERIIIFACIVLSLVLVISVIKTVYISFKTPIFLKFQADIIRKFTNSDFAQKLIYIDQKIKKSKSKKLTKEQSTAVLTNLQTGLLFHRFIYFWAYQLEKYRASKISFVLSGVSYVWLYIKLIVLLSFINYGIYRFAPTEFISTSNSFIYFISYSLNSLFLNETRQVIAMGNISTIVRIVTGVIGPLLLGVLGLNFIYTATQSKNDQELTKAVNDIKSQGKELEKQIKNEYSVTTEEAIRKLHEFKTGLFTIILLISSKLPKEYISEFDR